MEAAGSGTPEFLTSHSGNGVGRLYLISASCLEPSSTNIPGHFDDDDGDDDGNVSGKAVVDRKAVFEGKKVAYDRS